MKIIDLAEKQKNNEIMPEHIKYKGEDLYFDGISYYDKEGNNDLLDILAMDTSILTHLFDNIEIIEEEKKIPEKINDINCNYYVNDCYYEKLSKEEIALDIITLLHKINEIIDYLKSKGE